MEYADGFISILKNVLPKMSFSENVLIGGSSFTWSSTPIFSFVYKYWKSDDPVVLQQEVVSWHEFKECKISLTFDVNTSYLAKVHISVVLNVIGSIARSFSDVGKTYKVGSNLLPKSAN